MSVRCIDLLLDYIIGADLWHFALLCTHNHWICTSTKILQRKYSYSINSKLPDFALHPLHMTFEDPVFFGGWVLGRVVWRAPSVDTQDFWFHSRRGLISTGFDSGRRLCVCFFSVGWPISCTTVSHMLVSYQMGILVSFWRSTLSLPAFHLCLNTTCILQYSNYCIVIKLKTWNNVNFGKNWALNVC